METPPRPRKIVSVAFYRLASGSEPVRKWLKSLHKEDRQTIGEDIKTVEWGWPLGMPLVSSLGAGLWEVRSNIRHGIARVIFSMSEKQMVLLHGFVKKSQKTPAGDLRIAARRAKDLGVG